jgi:hypothetical protein
VLGDPRRTQAWRDANPEKAAAYEVAMENLHGDELDPQGTVDRAVKIYRRHGIEPTPELLAQWRKTGEHYQKLMEGRDGR